MPIIDPLLAEILVCPRCQGALEEDEAAGELVCTVDGSRYPVDDGVPNMIIDD